MPINRVGTRGIEDGAVATVDVAPGAVTSAKIADGGVSNDKLANSTAFGITLGATSTRNDRLISWQSVVTTNTTMVAGRGYFVDTSSGQITMTLPASAVIGDTIAIKDYTANFGTNKITIGRNGHNIQGQAANANIETNRASVELVYVDSTKGWLFVIESNVGSNVPTFTTATGGTITESGNYKIHSFTGDGNFIVSAAGNSPENPLGGPNAVSYLVVAGGGGGGVGQGGGGGAGGFREGREPSDSYSVSPLNNAGGLTITAQTYPISVGAGGSGAPNGCSKGISGSNSVFSTITSAGGGGGGTANAPAGLQPGIAGGSGGGGGETTSSNAAGNTRPVSPRQGIQGGTAPGGKGGGGGGATANGGNATSSQAGNGGAGATSSITGSPVARAGGGGGGGQDSFPTAGSGGAGGGGAGGCAGSGPDTPGTAGTANTGGGGGSGQCAAAGGKGIVIIRYKFQ